MEFKLHSKFKPTGDQPQAINKLANGLENGKNHQILKGVTGSGKTFTMANIIQKVQRPTLVIAHNKTLAYQLASEFREFFPENAVEFFVSYYDYYQPEAYVVQSDTYIEKDSSINEELDKLRHSATMSLFERRDVIIVSSVSCIYGLGDPIDYENLVISLRPGMEKDRTEVMKKLIDIQYVRNDINFTRGTFRVRGDSLDIFPASSGEKSVRIEFFGDEIDRITEIDALTGEIVGERNHVAIYPASHYATTQKKVEKAIVTIEEELEDRLKYFKDHNKLLEAQRLEQRTRYDIEMLKEMGFCTGIENYSRHMSQRKPGSRPYTLIDYFPKDFVTMIDESHVTVPQIGGMYEGDRSRKTSLVDYGFRLPSALDNRPLRFNEFESMMNQVIYVSATPGKYEKAKTNEVVEQIIRPTGLLDPKIEVRPTKGQIDDLVSEINKTIEKGERVLITTLTKKMSEDLREGLDLPEVSLIAILDADKEGFLRSETSLIQTIGRAARNSNGHVIMYGDTITRSMDVAITETNRRREIQEEYNEEHNIIPTTINKSVRKRIQNTFVAEENESYDVNKVTEFSKDEIEVIIENLNTEMLKAAEELDFERAATLRDQIRNLKNTY